METESAFDTEMIFLLIAIDICVDKDVTIYSDCKSALALLNGHNKGSFFNILSGWTKPLGCILNKVKAHPEKYKLPKDWQPEDKGIWIADQIPGGLFAASKKIAASIWLKRVSFTSKATIVDRNGVPFFKDISRRWSKHNLKMYLEGRDEDRAERGKKRIWKDANLSLSQMIMGRNSSIADRAAVQRVALDKMWRWYWAREDNLCSACSGTSVGIAHPILKCRN